MNDDTFSNLEKNLDQIKGAHDRLQTASLLGCDSFHTGASPLCAGKVRIQIGCGTLDDTHLPTCRLFHEALLQHGVDHTCVTTPPNVLLPCCQQLAALI